MDYGLVDITTRSRATLLAMLDANGYNTTPYSKFSPKEIELMIGSNLNGIALQMDLKQKDDANAVNGIQMCRVLFHFQRLRQQQQIQKLITELLEKEETRIDPKTTEIILVLYEPIVEIYHTTAFQQWKKNGLHIRFFEARSITTDPSSYSIVPKHEKVSEDEAKRIMKENFIRSKAQFPIIRFHEDIQARWLKVLPGELVKITRPSPSAGEYIIYRVCAP